VTASPSTAVLEDTQRSIQFHGVATLTIDDLTTDDLTRIEWSGSPLHVASVHRALERVAAGEGEYLAARSPDGWPIAKAGINYAKYRQAGTLSQLATHRALQGLGIGTCLIAQAEGRIASHGLATAMIDVEDDNRRARALYERLGYEECGRDTDSWKHQDAHGTVSTHHAQVIILRKRLARPP
jgi:ribosomal protein S18 acetylase RimI-like enzyme